jgi:hypothetical protein
MQTAIRRRTAARRGFGLVAMLGLLASVGIMAAAPAAEATIVVGQGIAGVKIGDTEAQVKQAIGQPASTLHAGATTTWRYPKGLLGVVSFDHQGRVSGMWTASKQQRTSKGIGLDSSPAQVRKAYPAAKCTAGAGPGAGPGEQSLACIVKSKYHGQTVETAFEWRNETVAMEEIDVDVA